MHAAQGVLTSRGGLTSHAAVVARGWGKCCVVGAGDVVVDEENHLFRAGRAVVREGQVITLNGATGEVIVGAQPLVDPTFSGEFKTLLGWARDRATTRVRANADTPADATKAREFGAEGIGLVRTEHMFFGDERIPIVREMIMALDVQARKKAVDRLLPFQREDFIGIFRAMAPHPVTIRLLDPPLHEFLPKYKEVLEEYTRLDARGFNPERHAELGALKARLEALQEANPMLGHRGCRLGITFPEIYDMQVRAIMEAACEVAGEGLRGGARDHDPAHRHGGRDEADPRDDRTGWPGRWWRRPGRNVALLGRHHDRGAARRAGRGPDRGVRRVLLVRHERPDPDDVRLQPRRHRQVPAVLPREEAAARTIPSRCSTSEGVGELVRIGIERGRQTRARTLKVGHLRRARRRAFVGGVLPPGRDDLRLLLALHGAGRVARGGPGGDQGAAALAEASRAAAWRGAAEGEPSEYKGSHGATRKGGRRGEAFRRAHRARVHQAGRRGSHLRSAGRRGPADLRRPVRLRGAAPHPGAPGGRRRARGGRLRADDRQGRGLPRHLGAGRDQPGDRAAGRADGLDPDRGLHRSGADPPRSATTRSRRPTTSASRARPPSTTSWSRTARTWPRSSRRRFTSRPPGARGRSTWTCPKDILVKEWTFEYPERVHLRSYNPTYEGHPGQIKKAARSMVRAKRPVLYVGGGAISSDASPELRELADLTQIPVTQTLMGLGAFPMARSALARHARHARDLLRQHGGAPLGLPGRGRRALRRSGDRQASTPSRRTREIIHIDIDPSSISKNIKVDIPIVGDCKRVLRRLVEAVREELKDGVPAAVAEGRRQWAAQIAEWKRDFPLRYDWDDDVIKPQYVIQELSQPDPGRGLRGHRASASTRCGPPSTTGSSTRGAGARSGGLGTMGYGLPTAMGVQAAHPGKLVVNIDGDGSLRDEQPGARHLLHREPAGQDRHHQQQRARHGAAVAAHHLQGALLRDRPARHPGLGPARGGVRLRGHPRDEAERGRARDREDDQHAGARWSWTSAWTRTSACSRWCRPAAPTRT